MYLIIEQNGTKHHFHRRKHRLREVYTRRHVAVTFRGQPAYLLLAGANICVYSNTIKDTDGATILEKYYADQTKYAFSFQMMAYISRLSLLRDALKGDYDIIVTERSVYTDSMVFAKMLYDDKKIEEIEYMIYKKWFDEFLDDLPEIRLVYVKTDPKIASRRVEKRAREGETIPLSYLENCHKYHEDWLTNHESSRLLVLDADVDTTEFPSVATSWVSDIEKFILPIKSDSDTHYSHWPGKETSSVLPLVGGDSATGLMCRNSNKL